METDEIYVQQLKSGNMLRIPVSVNGVNIQAIVDSAAEVTIISDGIYRRLSPKPETVKTVRFHTAGKNLQMLGFVVGPIEVKLEDNIFKEWVYVAPIEDDMLLGLDFLQKYKVDINISNSTLVLGNLKIKMSSTPTPNKSLGKVSVLKKRVIPPNSVKLVKCYCDTNLDQFYMEPTSHKNLLISKSLINGKNPVTYVLNLTNNHQTLKKNTKLGAAHEFLQTHPIPEEIYANAKI